MNKKRREQQAWLDLLEHVRKFLIRLDFKIDDVRTAAPNQLAVELEEIAGIKSPKPNDPWSRTKSRIRKAVAILVQQGQLKTKFDRSVEKLVTKAAKRGSSKRVHEGMLREFYKSYAWRKFRYQVLLHHGRKCLCCGQTKGMMHVDHIKPLRKYWELRLEFSNMQVLCDVCNHGKGSWDETDFRAHE